MLIDWLVNLAPPSWRQSHPRSQDLFLSCWARNEVEPTRDINKKFPALSVDRPIFIEFLSKGNLIRRIKRIETMKLELSLIQMYDQICNTMDRTKVRLE